MKKRLRNLYRLALLLMPNSRKRTQFIKKHKLFGMLGDGCIIQSWQLPLYSELVFIHDNVKIATDVHFVTHDGIHAVLNKKYPQEKFIEKLDCIEINDNVFVGSGTRILYGVRIGSNVIIGANSLVNKDVPDNCVYAGVLGHVICSFDDYMEKARRYSKQFTELYGIEKVRDVDSNLADKMYKEFLRRRQ